MKIVGLSGSIVGTKTKTAMDYTIKAIRENYEEIETTLIDLAAYDIQFSDGRNYFEYEGDTRYVAQTIIEADSIIIRTTIFNNNGICFHDCLGYISCIPFIFEEADAIIIGTPIFQASIPATLKNIFDLLPENAFQDKVVSMLVTAGSPKHYLIVEQQLKPILAYMKAQIVQTYVFIEEQDFYRKEIINDDVLFRIERLVEDTVVLKETYTKIREAKEAEYGF